MTRLEYIKGDMDCIDNLIEYEKRMGVSVAHYQIKSKRWVITVKHNMRPPTKLDIILGYVTMTIPAAMMARVVRKLTNRKGTPVERFLMNYYFNMSVKLLMKE